MANDEEKMKSLERIKKAIEIMKSDTLSRIHGEERVIWTATSSHQGSQTVTVGDLINLVSLADCEKD